MSTSSDSAVELLVRFASAGDPPVGSVRRPDGTEEPFSGWLGLVRVLEDNYPRPTPRPGDDDEELR